MSSAPQAICSTCGATILATTAAHTGGLCMPCKQGIRQSIESAKVYYQQQLQPDPFRDYWTALVHRVCDTPDGFYRLSPHEQTYFSVYLLEREVYNGGMDQFFHNSSGEFYHEALRGLEELGASRCHALLLVACRELFPAGEPPRDTAARRAVLPSTSAALESIDSEFCDDPDALGDRLRRYALDHQLVRPAA